MAFSLSSSAGDRTAPVKPTTAPTAAATPKPAVNTAAAPSPQPAPTVTGGLQPAALPIVAPKPVLKPLAGALGGSTINPGAQTGGGTPGHPGGLGGLGGAAALPGAPGAQVTPYAPGQDYRFHAITPGQDADRYKMAQTRFQQFASDTNPEYEAAIRRATQMGAANGRIGSGMLAGDYGTLADRRIQSLRSAETGFLTDALEGTIGDQARYRDELRGERAYQYGQGRDAQGDRIQQTTLEDALLNSEFARQQGRIGTLANLGQMGAPWNLQMGAASDLQGAAQAGQQGLGDLFSQWAYRNEMGGNYPPSQQPTDPRYQPPPGTLAGVQAQGSRSDPYYGQRPGSYYYGG